MAKRPLHPQRGQMLVVVMLMITTIIIMFGMTISVGHLVQSKINLQNSVDLAAMSSASYQARYMDAVSVANLRIRNVLKFFLLDSYVTQTRFNAKFQSEALSGGGGLIEDPLKTLAVCQQAALYDPVAAIGEGGRGVDIQTNLCRNLTDQPVVITPLIASPFPGLNPIYIFINIALLRLAAEFEQACWDWNGQNKAWALWAVDRAYRDTKNQADQMNLVLNKFAEDMGGDDKLKKAGGTVAYSTFVSNLIGALRSSATDDNSLRYINDTDDRVLTSGDLTKSEKNMGLAYLEPEWSGGCAIKTNLGGARGAANKKMVQGFSKNPGKTVAVGLIANADSPAILFWPQGIEPAMVALAAAKPFGSRIGPPASYFAGEGGSDGFGNVSVFAGDDASDLTKGGYGHKEILSLGFNRLPAPGSGVPSDRPKQELQTMAYAPSIFDSMFYSVFPQGTPYEPSDVLPVLSINSQLKDRGGILSNPSQLPPLPSNRKFYNQQAINSAWAPGGEARNGYQIKLLSMEEFCNTGGGGRTQQICSVEGVREL